MRIAFYWATVTVSSLLEVFWLDVACSLLLEELFSFLLETELSATGVFWSPEESFPPHPVKTLHAASAAKAAIIILFFMIILHSMTYFVKFYIVKSSFSINIPPACAGIKLNVSNSKNEVRNYSAYISNVNFSGELKFYTTKTGEPHFEFTV